MAKVYVVGTCDTKGDELRYAAECVAGVKPLLANVPDAKSDPHVDLLADVTAGDHLKGKAAGPVLSVRTQAISAMAKALSHGLLSCKDMGSVQDRQQAR